MGVCCKVLGPGTGERKETCRERWVGVWCQVLGRGTAGRWETSCHGVLGGEAVGSMPVDEKAVTQQFACVTLLSNKNGNFFI